MEASPHEGTQTRLDLLLMESEELFGYWRLCSAQVRRLRDEGGEASEIERWTKEARIAQLELEFRDGEGVA